MRTFRQIFLPLIITCSFNASAQSVREEMVLKGNWRFMADTGKQGLSAGWYKGLPAKAVPVQVPHTWNVMRGYENYTGLAWYEKKITIPARWKNKHLRLKFAAVYHDATVYLNGVKLQEHNNSGYTTFYVTLPASLTTHTTNTLVVSVSNAYSATNLPYLRAFDWCNDGGIIRDVTLQASGSPSIRYVHVTPNINFKDTSAKATIALRLWEDEIDTLNAVINIRERKTAKPAYQKAVTLHRSGNTFSTIADLGKIHLWHFNDPFLYDVTVTTKKNGRSADQLTSHFGCRTIDIQGKNFLLNQEPVRLPGIEYMPGSYPLYGNAEPRWVMDSVVKLMKDLNITISRFHWQVDEHILNRMDEWGILLQEEIPWWQQPGKLTPALEQTARQQFTEMIERDYNHPCIIAWGISNEVYGNDRDPQQYISLKSFARSLDSTRLVTVVSNEIFKRKEADESLIGDLPTWNEYVGTWFGKATEELPQYFREIESFLGDRPLFITENGLCEPRFAGGDQRRRADMIDHYKEWAKRPYIMGCIYFSLNDYRTHMGEDGARNFKARIHGITDLYLRKKPSYYIFKQLACPVEISNVKKLGDTRIRVTLFNKNTLPSYTIRQYVIKWKDQQGKNREQRLPVMKPGDTATIELDNMQLRFAFDIMDPAGSRVMSYPFIY